MTPAASPAAREQRAVLPRELADFLTELSIGVHRFAMYPPGHPSLAHVTENVRAGASALVEARDGLVIGVAHRQLVIDGVSTDPKHPVLSDLARRLHRHQLGGIAFEKGLTLLDVEGLIRALAAEADGERGPLGLLSPAELPVWDHVRILPAGYDRLELGDGGQGSPGDRSLALWTELTRSALARSPGAPDAESADGAALANLLTKSGPDAGREAVIVDQLLQLARELRSETGAEAAQIREKVSEFVSGLDPETLRRMLALIGSSAKRKHFVLDSSQALTADAVMAIVQAAAAASEQTISNSLTRLLSKMAIHAERGSEGTRARADAALRENVEALIAEWELRDPNPEGYTLLLDSMANASPVFRASQPDAEHLPGSMRIFQTALEVDAWGPTLQKAVSELVEEGRIADMLDLVDRAGEGNGVAERLRAQLATPFQLERLLAREDADERSLGELVRRIGDPAVDTLLDFLSESEYMSARRMVFDCLGRMGGRAAEKALERLADPRWFVQRNMLALLSRMEPLPDGFDPRPYLTHADVRVRREAFPLALRSSRLRARALAAALGDDDERLVRMGLLELQRALPETLVPVLVARVIDADRPPELRALAIRSLGASASPLALERLLRFCDGGRTILFRRRLPPSSPELLAALAALATRWSGDERAARVLKRARASRDPEIRAAAAAGGPVPAAAGGGRAS